MKYLVKAKCVAFAAVMLIGTAAYGQFAWTSSPTPSTVPSNAFINVGDNEVHYYFQRVTYTAVLGVTAAADIIITMPADGSIAVAAPNGGVYTDGISLITSSILGVVSVSAADANSITVAVAAVNPILVGEVVTIIFPIVTDSSLSTTGPKTAYTFSTSDNLLDGAGAMTTVDSVTFAADIKPVTGITFDGTYLHDDGTTQTATDALGEYHPGEGDAAVLFTAAMPDWVIDNGTSEVSAADPWTGYEVALDGVNNGVGTAEIQFQVWASQTPGLEYLDNGVATALFRHNAGTEALADDFYEAGAMADALRTAGLTEGIWYIYISSSATADWALAQSDTLVVKHHPSFVDPDATTPPFQYDNMTDALYGAGEGQGIDYDHDTIEETTDGANDDIATLTLDTGNIVGYDATTGVTAYDYVDIYWHGKDVDDPDATVQVFLSLSAILDTSDVTVAAGLVDLAGATEITTAPMLLDDPVNYIRYTVSTSPVQTADDYYFYLVAWDGANKTVQIVTDATAAAVAPTALVTTIKHSPTFEFQDIYAAEGVAAPAGQVPLDTQTSAAVKVSWGETVLSARDIDASAGDPLIIKLYSVVSNQDNVGTVDGEHGTLVGVNPLSDAGLLGYAGTVLLETITDTLDGQLDNSYMWDFRSVTPALSEWAAGAGTEWEYFIYAVVSQGGDKVVVQYNSDGTYNPGVAADDRGFQITHSPYFQAKNPVPNSSIELVVRDNFTLEWEGFDYTSATAEVQMLISPTVSAIDYTALTWATIPAATNGVYWLDVTGALDGSTKPLLTDGILATTGSFSLNVSGLTDDIGAALAVRPSLWGPDPLGGDDDGAIGTEYDVWYFIDEDGDNFGVGTAEVPIKAPGTIFFSIEDPGTAQNLRISPNKPLTAAIGDVITLSVEMSTGAAGADIDQVNFAIDFESDYLSVVDAGAGPFTAGPTLTNAVINNSSLEGSTYELNGAFDGATVGAAATWEVIATFDVTVTANPAAGSPIHALITFVDDGAARETRLYDNNNLPVLTSYDGIAADVHLVRPGRITGNVEIEGRSDKAQDVSFLLVPRGSMQPISNTGYIAANDDDADATNGVGMTLDANGAYTLSAIPTGRYDLILRKGGYLDQKITNLTVAPMVDLAQNFLDGDKLFGGDAAGYDHDNSAGTLDVGDNQIDAIDDAPAFTAAMTATPDSSAWNVLADITGDSLIWADDWAIMVKNQNRTSEGVTYKAMPGSGNENLIASLALVSEAGNEKTYAVSISQSELRGYAVKLGITSDWELVSYADGLASHRPALDMHKSLGYDELFISATKGFNPINSDGIDLLTFTVKSLASDPEAISISSAEIVGLDGKLSKAVIEASAGLPKEFTLSQNYPNPFNPTTTINFALPAPGDVRLVVYNLLGQEVQTMVSGAMEPGAYHAMWNSMDNSGRKVSSGVYFYRLVVDGKIIATKKMLMLK